MENCFLALKVTFCNEFADIAQKYGISYPELREIFIADGRMGDSHTFVYPEAPYYNSHCLNKDIPALIAFAGRETAPLMSAVDEINKYKKNEIE
jgi:UDP-glucose 6-dehydrogenase